MAVTALARFETRGRHVSFDINMRRALALSARETPRLRKKDLSSFDPVVGLQADARGCLIVTLASGQRYAGVEPVRTFPWSAVDSPIAFVDANGRQVAMIESLATASRSLQEALEEELSRREFVPVIQKIVSSSHRYPPCEWEIETDRGPTRIHIESEDEIRRLSPHSFLITDRSHRRFRISNTSQLDSASQQILRRVT